MGGSPTKKTQSRFMRLFGRRPKRQFPPPHWAAEGARSELPAKEGGEPAAIVVPMVEVEKPSGREKKGKSPRKEDGPPAGSPGSSRSPPPVPSSKPQPPLPGTTPPATSAPTSFKPSLLERLSSISRGRSTTYTPAPTPSASSGPIDGLPAPSDTPKPLPALPANKDGQPEAIVICDAPDSAPPTPSHESPPKDKEKEKPDVTASTLAQRITSAIYALPALASSSLGLSSISVAQTAAAAPPDVLKLLSNPRIMNGKDGARSVWEALEAAGRQRAERTGSEEGGEAVMLSAPLGADRADEVTINEGEEVDVPESGRNGETGKGKEKEKKLRKVRMFIPSKETVSFKATWWGFTIYLPPPVLMALNDSHLTAAKRAAMLFATLQWILRQLPTTGLPPQATTTIRIVRTLLPLLAALGTAISAAWAGIRSFDRGLGVKLSATWLMPLVMIPRAWEEADDFPLGMMGVSEGEEVQYVGRTGDV